MQYECPNETIGRVRSSRCMHVRIVAKDKCGDDGEALARLKT